MRIFAVLNILLSVQEPVGDLVLGRVQQDGGHLLELFLGKFSGALGGRDTGLAAAQEGETAADTLDGGEGEGNLALTINVGIQNTNNVLEAIGQNERHFKP